MKANLKRLMWGQLSDNWAYREQCLEQVAKARTLKFGVVALDVTRRLSFLSSLGHTVCAMFGLSLLALIGSFLMQWSLYGALVYSELNLALVYSVLISMVGVFCMFRSKFWMNLAGLKQEIEQLDQAQAQLQEGGGERRRQSQLVQVNSQELEQIIAQKLEQQREDLKLEQKELQLKAQVKAEQIKEQIKKQALAQQLPSKAKSRASISLANPVTDSEVKYQ